MKFFILLPAALAVSGVYGSPVSPTCSALDKLSADLHETTTYLQQVKEHPSSNVADATSQLARGLAYVQNIVNDLGSFEINAQVRTFVIPEIQKALQNRINQLESPNSKSTTFEIETTISSLSKTLDHATSLFDTSRASVCASGTVAKNAQSNIICAILQLVFDISFYVLLNINGLASLVFNLSFVLGCTLSLF